MANIPSLASAIASVAGAAAKAVKDKTGASSTSTGGSNGNNSISTNKAAQSLVKPQAASSPAASSSAANSSDGWVGIPVSNQASNSMASNMVSSSNPVSAGNGAVSHAGQGNLYMRSDGSLVRDMGNGNAYVVNRGEEKYNALHSEYLQKIINQNQEVSTGPRAGYTNEGGSSYPSYNSALATQATNSAAYEPVNQDDYMSNVLSYDDALAMAKKALTPQYQSRYEQSAAQAAQNLGSSGLYDSVYGQALMADAQRDIDRDLEAAIQQLALQLQGSSRDEALALLQLAVNDNQFGANFNQSAMLEDRAYNERMLDRMIAQFNSNRDYSLAQQAQDLKVRTQNFYEKQANWQMGGFDSQFQMQQALYELEQKSSKGSSSGGSSGGNNQYVSLATEPASAASIAGVSGTIVAPNQNATGGYDYTTTGYTGGSQTNYSDAGTAEMGQVNAELYRLSPQANSIRMSEGNVSAVDWIARNASSEAIAEMLMQQLGIPKEAFNSWLGELYAQNRITKEQYLSKVKN